MYSESEFIKSVFINCPFDSTFAPRFRAIVYTLIRLGFVPRCALESGNSGLRIIKILELIVDCRYGIHDISMQSLDARTGLPRFNMPFELGLFLGCQHFSDNANQKSKALLVLDSAPYRFRESLSDFAGYDVACQDSSPDQAIQLVRDWLANSIGKTMYGAARLQSEFREFESQLPGMVADFASHPDQTSFTDICHLTKEWGAFPAVRAAG